MTTLGTIDHALFQKSGGSRQFGLTLGLVVDTNDPQQMGRIRVWCPAYGDKDTYKLKNIPWAVHVTPLAGMTNYGKRGPSEDASEGTVAYGMWNVPTVRSYVLIGCIDGDTSLRFWIGCVHPQYVTHTMPHGRFTWNDQTDGLPDGPLDTLENPIQPLYRNLTEQFTKEGTSQYPEGTPSDPRRNMEWRSRGVDTQVSAIYNLHIEHPEDAPGSEIADHDPGNFFFTSVLQEDGSQLTVEGPGYSLSTLDPLLEPKSTAGINYDSHVYSWTTPAFHSYSMDDRPWNSRVRIRTTTGHQIILDDTNERIYINTAGGDTWIELDQAGNIDIHASRNVSMHAGGDFNFTTDQTFRVHAKQGIHMYTDDEFRVHSQKDVNIHTAENLRVHSLKETRVEAEEDMYLWGHKDVFFQTDSALHLDVGTDAFVETTSNLNLKAGSTLFLESTADTNVKAGATANLEASTDINILAAQQGYFTGTVQLDVLSSGPINIQGAPLNLNSGAATAGSAETATSADGSDKAFENQAFWTSRVPQHEPWGRVFMKKEGAQGADNNGPFAESKTNSNTHNPEYPYAGTEVNKGSAERGETYQRNQYWRR